MGENRRMCKATTKVGGPCPHYALNDSAYCRMHLPNAVFERICRVDDCDRPSTAMDPECTFHRVLNLARYLRDDQDLADLITRLGDVKVLTAEEHEQSRRDMWLRMVARSVKDLNQYRDKAASAGATDHDVMDAIEEADLESERMDLLIAVGSYVPIRLSESQADGITSSFRQLLEPHFSADQITQLGVEFAALLRDKA